MYTNLITCVRCWYLHNIRFPCFWIPIVVIANFREDLIRIQAVIQMHVEPEISRRSSENFVLYCCRNFSITWWEPWTMNDSNSTVVDNALTKFYKWFLPFCKIFNYVNALFVWTSCTWSFYWSCDNATNAYNF